MEMEIAPTSSTWPWATCSSLLVAASLTLAPASVRAGSFPGPDEVIHASFGDAAAERESILLTDDEVRRAAASAGQDEVSALVSRYTVTRDGAVVGYAYLDKHHVRTLPETLLIVLDANGVLTGVHVLAFREPREYLPRDAWYEQFRGMTVEDEIRMKRNIDGVTGATLTSRATTQAARRALAVHRVVSERAP